LRDEQRGELPGPVEELRDPAATSLASSTIGWMGRSRARGGEARFWRDDDLGGLELRRSSYDAACFARHTHDSYSVAVVERGRTNAYLGGRDLAVGAGEVVLLHPDEVHACNPVSGSGWRYWMLHLDRDWFRALALEVAGCDHGPPRFGSPVVRDDSLACALVWLSHLVVRGASRLEKEAAARRTFGPLLTRHCSVRAEAGRVSAGRPVRLVQEYIDAHLAENTSLARLGRLAGLSPYHLLRVFKASTGLPPHAWRNQRRIQHARRLLSAGRPICQVALDVGFADQSHFSHRFRASVGTTPAGYRGH
jgi:AraC-like DNA-binding protein